MQVLQQFTLQLESQRQAFLDYQVHNRMGILDDRFEAPEYM